MNYQPITSVAVQWSRCIPQSHTITRRTMLTITYPVPTHEWVTPQVRKLSSGVLEPKKGQHRAWPSISVQLRFLSSSVNSLWTTIFVGRADSCIKYDELERTLVLRCSIRLAEERKECSGRRGQLEAKNSVRGTVVRRKEALPHTHTPLGTKLKPLAGCRKENRATKP